MAPSDILALIEAYKRREIADAKARTSMVELRAQAARQAPPRGFAAAIAATLAQGRTA